MFLACAYCSSDFRSAMVQDIWCICLIHDGYNNTIFWKYNAGKNATFDLLMLANNYESSTFIYFCRRSKVLYFITTIKTMQSLVSKN